MSSFMDYLQTHKPKVNSTSTVKTIDEIVDNKVVIPKEKTREQFLLEYADRLLDCEIKPRKIQDKEKSLISRADALL